MRFTEQRPEREYEGAQCKRMSCSCSCHSATYTNARSADALQGRGSLMVHSPNLKLFPIVLHNNILLKACAGPKSKWVQFKDRKLERTQSYPEGRTSRTSTAHHKFDRGSYPDHGCNKGRGAGSGGGGAFGSERERESQNRTALTRCPRTPVLRNTC